MTAVWRPRRALAGFAAFALIAYLVVDLRVFPLQTRFPDEQRFITEAINFAQSGEFRIGDNRAWEMPLTGVFYGVLYAAVGSKPALIAAARCLQALMLIMMAWFAAGLARRLFRNRAAAPLAFVGVLVYPMFVAFQALLLSETMYMLLLTAAMWCLYWWADEPEKISRLVVYACVMAAATYIKASLTWLPLILPLLLVQPLPSWRKAARVFAVTAGVYCACLSPWWVRNAQIFGQPVWFTTSASSNLYLGNNRANLSAGVDWNRDVEQPFATRNDRLTELERDRAYSARAIEYITAEPGRFVADMARKFFRFWNVFPNHESFQEGPYRLIIAVSYGPALLLALCAARIYRAQWRRLLPVYALFAYLTLVHTVTIASLRYRLPLEVFLVVFAAGALAHWLQRGAPPNGPDVKGLRHWPLKRPLT
jgi:4-amino-4-deoxy-L-arabinose transferase-like glycosyltransferase